MSLQQSDVAKIADVLAAFEQFPAQARDIVVQGLPHAGLIAPAERHTYQSQFLEQAQKVLGDARGRAAEMEAASQAGVTAAEQDLSALRGAELEAANAAEAAKVEAGTKAEAQGAAWKAVKDAEVEQRDAESNHKIVEEQMGNLREEKAHAAALSEGSFRMLLEGGWIDEDMLADILEPVTALLTELKAEDALIAAAAKAFEVKPESRKAFDIAAIECASEVLNQNIAAINLKLEQGAPEEAQASAEALGFWALADVLRQRACATVVVLKNAETEARVASAAHEEAQRKVADGEALLAVRIATHAESNARALGLEEASEALTRLVEGSYGTAAEDVTMGQEEDIVMGSAVVAETECFTKGGEAAGMVALDSPAPLGA